MVLKIELFKLGVLSNMYEIVTKQCFTIGAKLYKQDHAKYYLFKDKNHYQKVSMSILSITIFGIFDLLI